MKKTDEERSKAVRDLICIARNMDATNWGGFISHLKAKYPDMYHWVTDSHVRRLVQSYIVSNCERRKNGEPDIFVRNDFGYQSDQVKKDILQFSTVSEWFDAMKSGKAEFLPIGGFFIYNGKCYALHKMIDYSSADLSFDPDLCVELESMLYDLPDELQCLHNNRHIYIDWDMGEHELCVWLDKSEKQ